ANEDIQATERACGHLHQNLASRWHRPGKLLHRKHLGAAMRAHEGCCHLLGHEFDLLFNFESGEDLKTWRARACWIAACRCSEPSSSRRIRCQCSMSALPASSWDSSRFVARTASACTDSIRCSSRVAVDSAAPRGTTCENNPARRASWSAKRSPASN